MRHKWQLESQDTAADETRYICSECGYIRVKKRRASNGYGRVQHDYFYERPSLAGREIYAVPCPVPRESKKAT